MTEPDPGEQLLRLMAPMRRAIIRATRVAEGLPTLPEAKVAVLRTLVRTGPLPPAQLALELHLARPTVSNLVRDMVDEGLLERRPSDVDKRSVLLVPTARARRVLDKFTKGRKEVVSRALADIPARDRARVLNAVPSLHRLLDRLEAMADQPGAEETA